MDERPQKPSRRPHEFADLANELSDLVESLGLEEAPRPPRRSRQTRPRRAAAGRGPAAAVATPETDTETVAAPDPEVEVEGDGAAPAPAAVEPGVGAAGVLEDTAYWVPPAEMIEPGGRPWSPQAAMELLPGSREAAAAAIAARPRSGWLMTAAACTAVALAVFALVVSHIDLGSTGGPDQAVSAPPFTLGVLRTVEADSSAAVATAQTATSFPSSTTHLFIDIHYTGATPHDSLELKVIHDSDGLPPPQVVQDHTYSLDTAGGQGVLTVELTAPAGSSFGTGRYTVSVMHGQGNGQTIDFTVGPG
jgi:hypothetical protein